MKLLFFHSRTCRTCRKQAEEFASHKPAVPVDDLDISNEGTPVLMRRYRVTDVPTSILVKDDGTTIARWVDFIESERINNKIKALD